jgi:tryptophan 6-halogenase
MSAMRAEAAPASPTNNITYTHRARAPAPGAAPPPYRDIAIIGGGTAGWMAAIILANALIARGARITVLESPAVGIIGVGEGSTPWLRGFFEAAGIEESEWMPEVNATYKCGIAFEGWSTKPGFESYFHPFASMLDNFTVGMLVRNADARVNGWNAWAHPNRFFIASRLAEECKAPRPERNFPFDVWYGYHFDAGLLGQFLHRKAVERGVVYKSCHVADVRMKENGDIAAVVTSEGETVAADLFVDCTGFQGLIIQKTLGTPFHPYADNLFNDSAIAMPTPAPERLPSQTLSKAMRHGWMWRIPLTNRFGNGYVYSSQFVSADEAERELREAIGMLDSPVEARHLRMRTGRVSRHWNRNCLAVGLSQGFIEPLEATALLFIQRTAEYFVEALESGDLSEAARERYNERLNRQFEGTRDYIVTHYKTNSRTDTEYWRANAANTKLSDALLELYAVWMSGRGIAREIGSQRLGVGYPIASWYSIFAGMGIFGPPERLRAPDPGDFDDIAEVDDLIARSAANFREQREVLRAIPPRGKGPSMQAYHW